MQKNKIIYIVSLSHSGSTLLSYILGSHSKINSFGEVNSYLSKKNKTLEGTEKKCSCGRNNNDCLFWSKVKIDSNNDIGSRYKLFLDKFSYLYPQYNIICDSSKDLKFLREIVKVINKENIKIIFLFKDPRNWVNSMKRIAKKKGKKFNYIFSFISWFKGNREIINYLKESNLNYIKLSYKSICKNYEKVNTNLLNFLKVEKEKLSPRNAQFHHIIFSNRMKLDKDIRISYDKKWKKDKLIKVFYIILYPILYFCLKSTLYDEL